MLENISKFVGTGVEEDSGIAEPIVTSFSSSPKQTCLCGCGGIPKGKNSKYCRGHAPATKQAREKLRIEYEKKKRVVLYTARNKRIRKLFKETLDLSNVFHVVFPWPCGCNCGGTPKQKNSKFCKGHQAKTKKSYKKTGGANKRKNHTEETKRKIGAAIKGNTHSVAVREKISTSHQGKKKKVHSMESKRKRRETMIKYIEKTGQCHPTLGTHEKQILDELENLFQLPIERKFRIVGYFPDGYIRELNLIIEIDEKRHFNCNGTYKKRDFQRQKEIEDELGCTFLRIKDDFNDNTFL